MKCPYCGGNIEIRELGVELLEFKCPYCEGIVKTESTEPRTKLGLARKMGKDYLEYRAKDREAERQAQLKGKDTIGDKIVMAIIMIVLGVACYLVFTKIH